jgi:MoaA/NifB/PqqE/SkfB family radical SAM enzyme
MHKSLESSIDYTKIDFLNLKNFFDKLRVKESGIDNNILFIFGGEPTLHPELIDLILLAKSYFGSIILQTNGSNPAVVEAAVASYPDIKLNYSFHYTETKFIELLKTINTFSSNLNEISIMDLPRSNIELYKKLKLIYKDKVQYYPLLPKKLDASPSSKHLVSLEQDKNFKYLKNDWAFIPHRFNKLSNYEIWKNNTSSFNKRCHIKNFVLFIQDNVVYKCFNDIFTNKTGIKLSEFNFSGNEYIISQCHNNFCYFDNEFWEN